MRTALVAVIVLAVALPFGSVRADDAAPPPGPHERLLPAGTPEHALLSEAGTWLLDQMRDDEAPAAAGGVRGAWWRQIDAHPFTTDSLYSGTAGCVLALMTLGEVTGDTRYATAARRGVRHLIDAAVKTPEGLAWDVAWDDAQETVHHTRYAGLYTGAAGIAWVLLTYGDATGDAEALAAGARGFDWVCAHAGPAPDGAPGAAALAGATFWDDGSLDVIGGNAGIALALLDAHRITGRDTYRAAAVAAADALLATADRGADGWSWKSALGFERRYSGFSHGTAGAGYCLARFYAATGDARYLEAARQAARSLEGKAWCIHANGGVAWRHHSDSKADDPPREGWCHGPAGTCRLHLLLHSLTGEAAYLETAEAAARWVMAEHHPTKDRAGSNFYAPSLCCGAAGVGTWMVELSRVTGKRAYLDWAAKITGYLGRVADRPKPGQACWSLSGRPEGKAGEVWHGTNLMTGQGGYIAFLAMLAREQGRVVREVFVPPDAATVGHAPGDRLLVVEYGAGASRFHASVRRLASFRGALWERIAGPDGAAAAPDATREVGGADALRDAVRRTQADHVAIAVAPEQLDFNLNRRIAHALATVDDDVFADATFGVLTGASPDHVRAMLDAMGQVEAEGMRPKAVEYGVALVDDLTVYPPTPEDGLETTKVFLPIKERCPAIRTKLKAALDQAAGAGFVSFGGNGDPMRVWLFADERNADPTKHWPYAPEKIVRDCADPDMPGLGASELGSWDVGGALLQFSTCHAGVPHRAVVEGDIVSTFGSTDRLVRFYDLTPAESLCLALLARGPCGLLAPIGANHGALTISEADRLHWENLPLGEAIRRGQIDVALHWLREGGVPLVQVEDGKPDPVTGGGTRIMRENTLNRLCFGDPSFRPFAARSPGKGSLAVERIGTKKAAAAFRVTVERDTGFEYWNPYAGDPKRGERLVAALPLAATEQAVARVVLASPVATSAATWAIERRHGRAPVLWIMLEAPDSGDYSNHTLWRATRAKGPGQDARVAARYEIGVVFTAKGPGAATGVIEPR